MAAVVGAKHTDECSKVVAASDSSWPRGRGSLGKRGRVTTKSSLHGRQPNLDFGLLGDLDRVIDLNAELSNGAFDPIDCWQ